MRTHVAFLRGINVGGHNKIKMAELRELCESIGFESPKTLLQSGNVVFRSRASSRSQLEQRLADGIEKRFGFRCGVLVVEPSELRDAIEAMPFDADSLEASHLMVLFLDRSPTRAARQRLLAGWDGPEQLEFGRRSLYAYYPEGAGRSKLTLTVLEKALGVRATARNWNTANKVADLAEAP